MSFRFRDKPLRREVPRVGREELEAALKEVLTIGEQSRSTAVHEARRHLKKARALFRLARPATGKAFYKRENAALRKMARVMAPIRDAHARVQTIDKLIASARVRRPPAAFVRARAAMLARLDQVLEEREKSEWWKQAASDLEAALCRLPRMPVKRLASAAMRSGIKEEYGRARRALKVAQRDGADENLHELRKGIKGVWHHLCLLAGDRPRAIKKLIKQMRDLGDKLGDDHDLAMLMAAQAETPLPNPNHWEILASAVARRRPLLQRSALRLAAKTLARKPGAFADFVIDRWEDRQ